MVVVNASLELTPSDVAMPLRILLADDNEMNQKVLYIIYLIFLFIFLFVISMRREENVSIYTYHSGRTEATTKPRLLKREGGEQWLGGFAVTRKASV